MDGYGPRTRRRFPAGCARHLSRSIWQLVAFAQAPLRRIRSRSAVLVCELTEGSCFCSQRGRAAIDRSQSRQHLHKAEPAVPAHLAVSVVIFCFAQPAVPAPRLAVQGSVQSATSAWVLFCRRVSQGPVCNFCVYGCIDVHEFKQRASQAGAFQRFSIRAST